MDDDTKRDELREVYRILMGGVLDLRHSFVRHGVSFSIGYRFLMHCSRTSSGIQLPVLSWVTYFYVPLEGYLCSGVI